MTTHLLALSASADEVLRGDPALEETATAQGKLQTASPRISVILKARSTARRKYER